MQIIQDCSGPYADLLKELFPIKHTIKSHTILPEGPGKEQPGQPIQKEKERQEKAISIRYGGSRLPVSSFLF